MSLTDHARAARILGDAFEAKRREHTFDKAAPILAALSAAYLSAAWTMEAEARKDAIATGGACTLDHTRLKPPSKCPACGATKP